MNRPIKFRGIQLDNGEMIYGFYAYKAETDEHFIIQETISLHRQSYFTDYKVDPKTVGQYVGLTDRNGKQIYEGDILFADCNLEGEELIGTVVWCVDDARYEVSGKITRYEFIPTECYVKGNINTHHHLLEVSNG